MADNRGLEPQATFAALTVFKTGPVPNEFIIRSELFVYFYV